MEEADVTFATRQVANEGLDAPDLDTVIFATSSSNWRTFVQGKGRGERRKPNKKPPIAILYVDSNVEHVANMARALRREMAANGLDIAGTSVAR